ncbi:hypothetical protein KIL84_012659 [Mauremys mutica]|uniref:Uncharacterized protein n=1 Tax=Mauremys mutica TaxID=74926 RepID=A0A9D3XSS9_9SAUR|nr:hypothetical protein KIL84_012659 [Mauremys mutica]
MIHHAVCQCIHTSLIDSILEPRLKDLPMEGGEGFRSAVKSLIHYSIICCSGNLFPLLPPKRVHSLIFPKMNTTVQIHRAQKIHICSTHYTLYKLDTYNSTECLSPHSPPEMTSISN